MKYIYKLETGLTRVKTNTKKYVAGTVVGIALAGSVTVPALAAKPANPGCFGRDRAAALHSMQDGGAPGASEWGAIAGERAGTNGQQNRDYRDACQQ